jgi:hypothetical protein
LVFVRATQHNISSDSHGVAAEPAVGCALHHVRGCDNHHHTALLEPPTQKNHAIVGRLFCALRLCKSFFLLSLVAWRFSDNSLQAISLGWIIIIPYCRFSFFVNRRACDRTNNQQTLTMPDQG